MAGFKAQFREFAATELLPTLTRSTLDASTRLSTGMSSRGITNDSPSQLIPAGEKYGLLLHPRYLKALRALFRNPSISFRNREQIQMVELVHRAEDHGLIVMPTGGGKTVAILINALLDTSGVTVVIVPFVPLLIDFEERMKNMPHIPWARYPCNTAGGIEKKRLLIVQLELATADDVLERLEHLSNCNLLRRIIIDEGHVILTDSDYREPLKRLCLLSAINVPIIVLTATVSPSSQDDLMCAIGLPPQSVYLVRSPCTSPLSIRYEVRRVEKGEVTAAVIACVRSEFVLAPDERGIIFFNTVADGLNFSSLTGIPLVHAKPGCDREKILHDWEDGQWIAGTSCLGQGIDKPNIRFAIHHGAPFDETQFIQESGRAGRDGKASTSLIIFDVPNSRAPKSIEDHSGVASMRFNLVNRPQCWRVVYTKKFDGVGVNCFTIPSAVLCELCSERIVSCRVLCTDCLIPNA